MINDRIPESAAHGIVRFYLHATQRGPLLSTCPARTPTGFGSEKDTGSRSQKKKNKYVSCERGLRTLTPISFRRSVYGLEHAFALLAANPDPRVSVDSVRGVETSTDNTDANTRMTTRIPNTMALQGQREFRRVRRRRGFRENNSVVNKNISKSNE